MVSTVTIVHNQMFDFNVFKILSVSSVSNDKKPNVFDNAKSCMENES